MVTGLNIIGQNKPLQDHWIKRIVALIIDSIIVWVVAIIFSVILVAGAFAFGSLFLGIGAVIYAIIAILYWIIQDAFMGGTVGKKLMGLRVVGTTGQVDIVKAVIRNVTKIHGLLLFIDWIAGLATEGDPRQKFSDRIGGTTVVRTDQHAYVEEQFRQMATPPPHPMAPQQYGQPPQAWPGQQAPPPGAAPPPPPGQAQSWPGQQPQPGTGWPQHQWNEQGQLVQQARFCSACGGPLVARGDGKMTCSRCGAVY